MKSWVSWICRDSQSGVVLRLINKFCMALLTCILGLGGGAIGAIGGAIKGQTTEIGFLRGSAVGAVAGAITGIHFMELIANGEPFSKVAVIFVEWVSPALLKAYQWQVSATETSSRDFSDIFEVNTYSGLSRVTINELPVCEFYSTEISCTICLKDMKGGESGRWLPNCKHVFHVHCIDQWLMRQGSCPICRKDVLIN